MILGFSFLRNGVVITQEPQSTFPREVGKSPQLEFVHGNKGH